MVRPNMVRNDGRLRNRDNIPIPRGLSRGGLQLVVSLLPLILMAVFSAPVQSYQVVSFSKGGTIQGKVVYQGRVSTRTIIPTKDSDVCGDMREQARIIVGKDKGVQDTFVYLKKVAKGKSWGKSRKVPQINNVKCIFKPHVQVIRAGDIDIVNSDPVLHNTHGFYGRRTAFNLALPHKNQRIRKRLKRPGQVRVECDAHGWMQGWIYVADNPYYALTTKNGNFTITNVLPGNYTLVATHEYTGTVETPVTIKAKKVVRVSIELKK